MRKLRKAWIWLVGCYASLLVLLPTIAEADTRKLSGIELWWAQMYNDNHLYFTILTIIIIPLTGCIFGILADLVMNHIGIDLKHRKAAE